jgi:hypothetical protein
MRSIRNLNPETITATPRLPDVIGATWDNAEAELLAAGWLRLDERDATPPEGMRVTHYLYAYDINRPGYALETPVFEAIPEPRPEVFAHGIEVAPGGLLVIPSHTAGKGVAIVATDDGDLVTVEAHASPWKSREQIEALIVVAKARRAEAQAIRIDAAGKARAAAQAAASANSVPALREHVAILAEQVQRISEAMA